MDNKAILDELLELLAGNDVKIRKDSLGGGSSGLCKIKDESFFLLILIPALMKSRQVVQRPSVKFWISKQYT